MKRYNKGYSMTEIIISMALIILLSAVGFATCVIAINSADERDNQLRQVGDVEKITNAVVFADGESDFLDAFVKRINWTFACKIENEGTEQSWVNGNTAEDATSGVTFAFDKDNSTYTLNVFYASVHTTCVLHGNVATINCYKGNNEEPYLTKTVNYNEN